MYETAITVVTVTDLALFYTSSIGISCMNGTGGISTGCINLTIENWSQLIGPEHLSGFHSSISESNRTCAFCRSSPLKIDSHLVIIISVGDTSIVLHYQN